MIRSYFPPTVSGGKELSMKKQSFIVEAVGLEKEKNWAFGI